MTHSNVTEGKIEVLVVEDSLTQAELLKYLLEQYGYQVSCAANGKAGLESARDHKPSLVIADVLMPEMDGYTLCKALKSDADLSDIPVLLVTSLSGPQDIVKGLQCGADSFIRKPYDERYLLARIKYFLANQELRKSKSFQMGVEIWIGGEKYFINSERLQILDLLISTYEQALHLNEELQEKQLELSLSYQWLDGLYSIAKQLNQYYLEDDLVKNALTQVVRLPGVMTGWIEIFDKDSGFRKISLDWGPFQKDSAVSEELKSFCREKFRSGDLKKIIQIKETESQNHQYVIVPLRFDDTVSGLLSLLAHHNISFSEIDMRNLESVGRQISVSLGRARLYQNLEQMVKERTCALALEIEKHKKANETISALYDEAKMALHARDEFLQLAAHELKTPLTPLVVWLQSLKRLVNKKEFYSIPMERVEQICSSALDQIKYVTQLIESLLNLSRISTGQIKLNREKVDLSQLVRDLVRRFSEELSRAKCEVEITARSEIIGEWDKLQLEQVIINLMTNAIKFGAGKPIRFTVELENGRARLTIQDFGIGIERSNQDRIFDRFERAVSSDRYGGLGVGLYIAREIVHAHGGVIQVESSLSQGSKFTLFLPLS